MRTTGKNKFQFLKFHLISSIGKPKKLLPREKWPDSWKRIYFKGYPRFERFSLPSIKKLIKNRQIKGESLLEIILRRKTIREKTRSLLTKEICSLLLLSGAITRVEGDIFYDSYRAYPSAGARYPLEIYILINDSPDFIKGLYHYHVRTHSLEYLWGINQKELKKCFPGQKFVLQSKAILIITAIILRSVGKYGERAYRYALLEAGHLAQNCYLISQGLNIGSCALGGFIDKEICRLLDIRISEELPLYCIAIL
jgi:SagB-type dehydrogenase family enzyme